MIGTSKSWPTDWPTAWDRIGYCVAYWSVLAQVMIHIYWVENHNTKCRVHPGLVWLVRCCDSLLWFCSIRNLSRCKRYCSPSGGTEYPATLVRLLDTNGISAANIFRKHEVEILYFLGGTTSTYEPVNPSAKWLIMYYPKSYPGTDDAEAR